MWILFSVFLTLSHPSWVWSSFCCQGSGWMWNTYWPTCQANIVEVVLETLSPIYPFPFNVIWSMLMLVHASLAVLTADPSITPYVANIHLEHSKTSSKNPSNFSIIDLLHDTECKAKWMALLCTVLGVAAKFLAAKKIFLDWFLLV